MRTDWPENWWEIFPELGPVGSSELEEGELPAQADTEVQDYSEEEAQ